MGKSIKDNVTQQKGEVIEYLADMFEANKALSIAESGEPMKAVSDPAKPAQGFEMYVDASRILIKNRDASIEIGRDDQAGALTEIIKARGTLVPQNKLLEKVLETDISALPFDYLPEKHRSDFEEKFSRIVGEQGQPENVSAKFNIEGFGTAQIDIKTRKFDIRAEGVHFRGTLQDDGTVRLAGKKYGSHQIGFMKAVMNGIDSGALEFRTEKEELEYCITQHLSAISSSVSDRVLPDFIEREIFDPKIGKLACGMKATYQSKEHIKIVLEMDEDMNISLRDTTKFTGAGRELHLVHDSEDGNYSLSTSMSGKRALSILSDFADKLENYGDNSLKFIKSKTNSGLGNGHQSFEHDYIIDSGHAQRGETYVARRQIGLDEI